MQIQLPPRNSFFTSGSSLRRSRATFAQWGFQLIELLIVLAVISVLAIVALPSYAKYRDRVDTAHALGDIASISLALAQFYADNNRFPDSLDDVHMGDLKDPWDNPYQYLKIYGSDVKGKGKLRKDKNLVPINTDFDLYSMGKDGASTPALTAKASKDDIIRANNGKFIGLAEDY